MAIKGSKQVIRVWGKRGGGSGRLRCRPRDVTRGTPPTTHPYTHTGPNPAPPRCLNSLILPSPNLTHATLTEPDVCDKKNKNTQPHAPPWSPVGPLGWRRSGLGCLSSPQPRTPCPRGASRPGASCTWQEAQGGEHTAKRQHGGVGNDAPSTHSELTAPFESTALLEEGFRKRME